MNTDESKQLEYMVKQIGGMTKTLVSAYEELKALGCPVTKSLQDDGKRIAHLLELAMQTNATLFEAKPDEAERKRRLELDDAFRHQLNIVKELLNIPLKEW